MVGCRLAARFLCAIIAGPRASPRRCNRRLAACQSYDERQRLKASDKGENIAKQIFPSSSAARPYAVALARRARSSSNRSKNVHTLAHIRTLQAFSASPRNLPSPSIATKHLARKLPQQLEDLFMTKLISITSLCAFAFFSATFLKVGNFKACGKQCFSLFRRSNFAAISALPFRES